MPRITFPQVWDVIVSVLSAESISKYCIFDRIPSCVASKLDLSGPIVSLLQKLYNNGKEFGNLHGHSSRCGLTLECSIRIWQQGSG